MKHTHDPDTPRLLRAARREFAANELAERDGITPLQARYKLLARQMIADRER